MKVKDIQKVAVLGAGTMGSQLAVLVAAHGFPVCCFTPKEDELHTIESVSAFADGWFAKSVAKGKMEEKDAAAARGRLAFTNDLGQAAKDAQMVVEAVADITEVKQKVLAEADRHTAEGCIYASNSSYIVSSRFCGAVKHPENVLNMHFFNPALVMKLVEVVKGPHVAEQAAQTAFEFCEALGKTPVMIQKEIYGFVVNRIFSAITKEACYLLDQGVAGIPEIDLAVKNGLGHPMGPFELLDLTGIDLEYDVLMEKYRMSGALADKPSPALVERYAQGAYGKKTKKGFYDYE
ncbi:MAG: 3-hydroxyacyl-CoA dehydrogenase family protein [Clostridiales Family XIII bacterium]|jgi:3-hydroxybutyryl-CoA dehydrogenase|nr:3-hydroxyacyl-CoA dehydrogenase family protein [Clostridiales Family XIII bacterium]